MSIHPFAGLNPMPSAWGYNWTAQEPQQVPVAPPPQHSSPIHAPPVSEPTCPSEQYANLPAALLSTMKREKKPFTYTPGGVNLSEVLNARLQKRMERKKKYSEDHHPPRQLVVAPTYNTALDMYSVENAMEALEVQAELVAADRSLSVPSPVRSATLPRNHTFRFDDQDLDPGPRGVTQSKAFRVLQIITDTEEDAEEKRRDEDHRDEMRFTGLRDSSAIPSKFFHTLQKITGTADEENEESRPQHFEAPRPQAPRQQAPRPQQQQRPVAPPAEQSMTPVLKRPAAFLPIKTSPGFRPGIHPPCLMANGRTTGHPRKAGTDF